MPDCSSPLYTSSGKLYPNDQELTYEKAAEYCEDRGLYLAAIRSVSTYAQIRKFARECGRWDRWQVGLKMRGQTGMWADGYSYVSTELFGGRVIDHYYDDYDQCRIPNLEYDQSDSYLQSVRLSTGCYEYYRFFCSDVGKKVNGDLDSVGSGSETGLLFSPIMIVGFVLLFIFAIGFTILRRYMLQRRISQMSSAAVQMSALQASATQVPPPPPPMQGYYPAPQMGAAPMQGYQPAPQMGTAPMQGCYPPHQMASAPPYQPIPQTEPPRYEATKML